MGKLIVANYKMNGDKNFYQNVQEKFKKLKLQDTKIILCPPFVYLPNLKINNKLVEIGAQDITNKIDNKSTGQIGPNMLKEFNVKYCLVGHFERQELGETLDIISKKIDVCIENDIQPIICIGINKNQKITLLKNQILKLLKNKKGFLPIFAYEPIWAINSNVLPNVEEINSAVDIITQTCKNLNFDCKILYGGSVDCETYQQIKNANVDGFLLGGVCLNIDETISLIKEVENE